MVYVLYLLLKVYYSVLKLKERAKEYFMHCLHLANALMPRNFAGEGEWALDLGSGNQTCREFELAPPPPRPAPTSPIPERAQNG